MPSRERVRRRTDVIFEIEEDPDGGFTAEAVDANIFTQGDTLAELRKNMEEAARCFYGRDRDIAIFALV